MKENSLISPATAYQIFLLTKKPENISKRKLRHWLRKGLTEDEIKELKEQINEISLLTREEFINSFKRVISEIADEYLKSSLKEVIN